MNRCPWSASGTCEITRHLCREPKRCSSMLIQWEKYKDLGFSPPGFRISYSLLINKKSVQNFIVPRERYYVSRCLSDLEYRPDLIESRGQGAKSLVKGSRGETPCRGQGAKSLGFEIPDDWEILDN